MFPLTAEAVGKAIHRGWSPVLGQLHGNLQRVFADLLVPRTVGVIEYCDQLFFGNHLKGRVGPHKTVPSLWEWSGSETRARDNWWYPFSRHPIPKSIAS